MSERLAGGVPRQMLEDVKFADWSPDGENLAVVRRVDGRDRLEFPIGNVLVAPEDGSGLAFPRLSADARAVAYVRHRGPASLAGRVEMVDLAGAVSQVSGEYLTLHGAAWKGAEIWFTAADERPLFRSLRADHPDAQQRDTVGCRAGWPIDHGAHRRPIRAHRIRLYVHGLGSEPPVPVTPEGVRGIDWALSPDGRLIAAIGPGRGIQLYSMDGNPPRQVPELTGGEVPIGWIGDGLLIRRRGEPGSFGDVFRVDVESGRQEFWKNILPRDRAGLLSLGSFHTQADGRVQAYTLTRALGTLYVADGLS